MRRNEKGFTLIELSLVVAIVSVMSIMAFPTFTGWIARAQLRDAARTVYSDLQFARIRAIETGGQWRVSFTPGDGTYTVVNLGPDMAFGTGDDVTEKVVDLSTDNKGISFGSAKGAIPNQGTVPPGGVDLSSNQIFFDAFGSARDAAGIGGNPADGVVYLKNERGETFAVELSSLGRVKMWRNYSGTWGD